ncbi:MAG: N-acyl homoserine lactonase family protein [Bacteroidota bacterium]
MNIKLFTTSILVFIAVSIHSFLKPDTEYFKKASGTTQQPTVKLYVFDGGTLENMDTKRFGLESNEVAISRMSVPCFLIVHPKGTLIWDTGAVPDTSWNFTDSPVLYKLILPNLKRDITLTKPIKMQLAEVGYSPTDIKYLALSHYHYDHTANANEFSNATWLVRQNEHDSMFAKQPPGVTRPSSYSALRNNKTQIIATDKYDVFGDGTVIIKSAPGHTPGHQVLFLKLIQTGNIVLSGDLYHYPEERVLNRVPTFDFNQEQTRSSRKNIDTFLKTTNAQLWIQHDFGGNSKLKKAPNYYE